MAELGKTKVWDLDGQQQEATLITWLEGQSREACTIQHSGWAHLAKPTLLTKTESAEEPSGKS